MKLILSRAVVAHEQHVPLTLQVDAFAGRATMRYAVLDGNEADKALNNSDLWNTKKQIKLNPSAYRKFVNHFGVTNSPRVVYVDFNVPGKVEKDGHFIIREDKRGWLVVPSKSNDLSINDFEGALTYGKPIGD